MQNKKGMSGIIITIIMVGLVLVAIAVVWGVINNIIGGQTQSIQFSEKCLEVDVSPSSANCSATACTVKIKRNAGGDEFDGIKAIFYYADGTSEVEDASGNIEELATVSKSFTLTSSGAERVEISPYFTDDVGEKKVCSQNPSLTIS